MAPNAYENEWYPPRRAVPGHVTAGAVAVLGSLALHALVLSRFPALPVGRPAPFRPDDRSLPPVVLHEVRPLPPRPPQRPPALRPEAPGRAYGLPPVPEAFRSALDPVLLAPTDPAARLAGVETALAPPPEAPARTAWTPRPERLEINRRLVRDDVSALPRRLDPALPRTAAAPDVVWPAEPPPPGVPDLPGGPGPAAEGAPLVAPPSPPALPGAGGPAPDLAGTASRLVGEGAMPRTGTRPIEQHLDLRLLTYRSPADPEYTYFAVRMLRNDPGALPVLPKDVLLVQDCSESMTQAKLDQCKAGLHELLAALREGDRFDVMGFRDTQYRCFDDWVPATAANRAKAGWFIEQMTARGRTDVYSGLEQILSAAADADRPLLAVVLSDGIPTMGTVSDTKILEAFSSKNAGRVSVFTLGGGPRINRFLLDFLAYKNRGGTTVVPARSSIPDAAGALGGEVSRPVLAGLSYRLSGVDEAEAFPRTPPHLYLDRPLVLFGRCRSDVDRAGIRIEGRAGARSHDLVYALDFAGAEPGDPDIRRMWAWQKAYDLIGRHIRTGAPGVLEQIRLLSVGFGIAVPYAAELGAD